METIIEDSSLVGISDDEKTAILKGIDREFSSYFDSTARSSEYRSYSLGYRLPLLSTFAALLLSLIAVFFYGFVHNRYEAHDIAGTQSSAGESSWAILEAYKSSVELEIRSKDKEILFHKEQIADYDRKLSALRNLIELKKRTESKLAEERVRLNQAGFSPDEIQNRLVKMEQELLSNTSAEMSRFNNMSIEELNREIDSILSEKTKSEIRMETSIVQRDTLSRELEKSTETPDLPAGRDQIALFQTYLTSKYLEIFKSLDNGNPEVSRVQLDSLESLLRENNGIELSGDQLSFHSGVIKALRTVTDGVTEKDSPDDLTLFTRSVAELNNSLAAALEKGNAGTAERALRAKIDSLPDLAAAYTLLIKASNQSADVKESTPAPQPVPQEGRVTSVSFNRLVISSSRTASLRSGLQFQILKQGTGESSTLLGVGRIISLENGSVQGELETIYDFSGKPEIGDRILFLNNLTGGD